MRQFFNAHEDRRASSFPDLNLKHAVFVNDSSGHVDEALEDRRSMLTFESYSITGESPVKCISDRGPQDVEMDSDHKGRGKGVEVKEEDKFGEIVFNMPSFGICFQSFTRL